MQIRPSHISDTRSMSDIYVQTWQETYLGVVPYPYLLQMSIPQQEKAFNHELKNRQVVSFVAEEAGTVTGFITGGYERNGDDIYRGEIYTLYVLKNFQRRGIGGKLVAALAARLYQIDVYSMLVRVLKHNPYKKFYSKANGTFLKAERLPFAGEMMELEVYGWLDVSLVCE